MMNIKNEKAVSPVIGVILMVVITVIIAAVLAVFAFGVGAPTQTPQASIKITSVNASNDTIWVQHYGGDAVRVKDIKITVETLNSDGSILATTSFNTDSTVTSQFTAGDTIQINAVKTGTGGSLLLNGAGVTLVTTPLPSAIDLSLTTVDSVRVTVIDVPTGSVLSKPVVKIS